MMLLLWITGALFSCKKTGDNVSINGQITGKEPGFTTINDLEIEARTVQEDSTRTDSLQRYYFGNMNDPEFGELNANLFFQTRLDQIGQTLGGSNTLDSVVLTFTLDGTESNYGNLSSPLEFDIYEVTEDLGSGVRHYSNETVAYDNTPIGSYSAVPNFEDSMDVRNLDATKKIGPSIRVKLSNAFATKLFNATESELSTQENFQQFLKGIAVIPRAKAMGEGGIIAFDMLHSNSQLTLYFDGTKQSIFTITNDSEIFSTYSTSNVPAALANQKNGSGHFDTTYIQGLGQSKLHITFPNLFKLLDEGPINVNQAKLKVKVLPNTVTSNYEAVERLNIAQPDPEDGSNAFILDFFYYFEGDLGKYNATDGTYEFLITRHIQDILLAKRNENKDENRGIYLMNYLNASRNTNGTVSPLRQGRVMLDTRVGSGISLEILYSKVK